MSESGYRSRGARSNKHCRHDDSHEETEVNHDRRRPVFVPGLKTEEGRAAFDAVMSARKKTVRTIRTIGFVFLLASCISAYVFINQFNSDRFITALGIVAIISLIACFRGNASMSQELYKSLPGSTDDVGKHRCISCGGFGIHRHTVYKTTTTLADCSKCGFRLWNE